MIKIIKTNFRQHGFSDPIRTENKHFKIVGLTVNCYHVITESVIIGMHLSMAFRLEFQMTKCYPLLKSLPYTAIYSSHFVWVIYHNRSINSVTDSLITTSVVAITDHDLQQKFIIWNKCYFFMSPTLIMKDDGTR